MCTTTSSLFDPRAYNSLIIMMRSLTDMMVYTLYNVRL